MLYRSMPPILRSVNPDTQAELEPYFESEGGTLVSYQPGISKDTADLVKQILEEKINAMGNEGCKGLTPLSA